MTIRDKLEIGLKPDAPYRPDNLPDFQKDEAPARRRRRTAATSAAPKRRGAAKREQKPRRTPRG
jgi:hypothetical protein